MKLKYKIFSMSVLSVLILIIFTFAIFKLTIFEHIKEYNIKLVENNYEKIDVLMGYEKTNLKTSLSNNGSFYNPDLKFDKSTTEMINFNNEILKYNQINMLIILDDKGEIFDYIDINLTKKQLESIFVNFKENDNYYSENYENFQIISGLTLIDDNLYMVGVLPLNKNYSELKTENRYAVLFLKLLNNETIEKMESILDGKIVVETAKDDSRSISIEKNDLSTIYSSKNYLDIKGELSISIKLYIENEETAHFDEEVNVFIVNFMVLIFIILVIDYFILKSIIFKRMDKINKFIDEVTLKKNSELQININGNDEINLLANSLNNMLYEITQKNKELKETEERYNLMIEATSDGYLDINIENGEIYLSQECIRMLEYQGHQSDMYHYMLSIIHKDYKELIHMKFMEIINGKIDYFEEEYKVVLKNETKWILHKCKIILKDSENRALRFVNVLSDITLRKKNEEKLIFLRYSDSLTGLKNRVAMENIFENVDLTTQNEYSYHIVVCDINGLKLTNNAFGYKEGDKLIKNITRIIVSNCETDDIVSRWAGDEFVILIKNKASVYVTKLMKKINNDINNITDYHFKISLAIGKASLQIDKVKDLNSLMNLAEKRMVRNKLIDSQSSRSEAINSLVSTLHEKSSETEEHTKRIKQLSTLIGEKLGLPHEKIDELKLLSLLHDIGKIGIPETILEKPGKLTEEEWTIMKTHTEIGYRIAKSSEALEHIADEILSHHEKYDGTGYPNGLKEDKIPYLSRIINVVDSFDVMTHPRVYKEARSLEYAISELKRCSGTQFDPKIVEAFLEIIENSDMTEYL